MNKHFWNGIHSFGIILFFIAIVVLAIFGKDIWVPTATVQDTFILGFACGFVSTVLGYLLFITLQESWE